MILILAGFACVQGQEVLDAVVAIVNDDVITLNEYLRQYEMREQAIRDQAKAQGQEAQISVFMDRLKATLLEELITSRLLLQEAEKLGIDVSQQVTMTIENIKQANNIQTDAQFERVLQQQGINFEQFRKRIEEDILQQALVYSQISSSIVIQDTEIVEYYNEHPDEFILPLEYAIKGIYVSETDKNPQELEALKNEIDQKISANEDFSALSLQYSQGPEKDSGGDLGSFKEGEMAPALENAVKDLNSGDVSAWIKVQGGWYILKLAEKKEARMKSFEDAKNEIQGKLEEEKRTEKLTEYLNELKGRSYIRIIIQDPLSFK
jgi:parvulin-like peptidyl-prolyl isomerase